MLKKKERIYIISIALVFLHLLINLFVPNPISNLAIETIHLFYFSFLLFLQFYMQKKSNEETVKVWTAYLTTIIVKFFIFLLFIYSLKEYFNITRSQALFNIFLWFFIYLFLEVKMIVDSLKKI